MMVRLTLCLALLALVLSGRVAGLATLEGGEGDGLNIKASDVMVMNKLGTEQRLIVTSDGVGIFGTPTDSGHKLQVLGTAWKNDGSTDWATTSDARVKTDILGLGLFGSQGEMKRADVTNEEELHEARAQAVDASMEKLMQLRPVTFSYSKDYLEANPTLPRDKRYASFLAQEFEEVFPESVAHTGVSVGPHHDILSIDTSVLKPYLVAGFQGLRNLIDEHGDRLDEMSDRLHAIEEQLQLGSSNSNA